MHLAFPPRRVLPLILSALVLSGFLTCLPLLGPARSLLRLSPAAAQVYNGGGLEQGLSEARNISGPVQKSPRQIVVDAVRYVLSFLTLAAVVIVIVAGIRLVVSQGEPEQKDKARKTIIYALIGLIIVLVARAIVFIALHAV